MSKKEQRTRHYSSASVGHYGIAGASLLASVFFAARGGVFARDWGQAVPI